MRFFYYRPGKVMDYLFREKSLFRKFLACCACFCFLHSSSYAETNNDPLEKFNRGVFSFNDKVDIYFLKPIATFYNIIMPKPLNRGIQNFFNNLNNIPTIANDILQANFYQANSDFWRLAINSTIGIGGLFDVAERMNLHPYTNDFGLTLAKWGYKNSTYIVLPFLGPSTIRDGFGIPVDYYGFSVYPRIRSDSVRYGLFGLGVINRRAQLLQFQSVFDEAALDKYVFIRDAYLQRRSYQMEQNASYGYHGQNLESAEQAKNADDQDQPEPPMTDGSAASVPQAS
jgi:phospholipid-binding lipoprotein MlaA